MTQSISMLFSLGMLFLISSCQTMDLDSGVQAKGVVNCGVGRVRFPTTRDDWNRLYANRGFYTDGNHLGRDLDLVEGTAIHPIACGTVRVFRAAQGYGMLTVVIEHRFNEPRIARDGLGSQVSVLGFLSIYGHLRPSFGADGTGALVLRAGDTVGPDDVIGYVEHDARNGDGAEHLHVGIRLQTMDEAERMDPGAWFRGYDTAPSQRQWFADPGDFLPRIMSDGLMVRWHPPGTVIASRDRSTDRFLVGVDDRLHPISPLAAFLDRLDKRTILVAEEEIGCYIVGDPYRPELAAHGLLKFTDQSTVYEFVENPLHRYTFISQEAFDSWGWQAHEVAVRDAKDRPAFLVRYANHGFRRLRDGSTIKARGQSEVAVVSDERRLPIFDWPTFLALGFNPAKIVEVDPSVIDQVGFPRGPMIAPELVSVCQRSIPCFPNGCDGGQSGGGAGTVVDLGSTFDLRIPPLIETCNGKDDDGNGQVDEIFLCSLGKKGGFCLTFCGGPGFRVCEAPNCDWSAGCHTYPEDCGSSIDEDCDGKTDCDDPDCQNSLSCKLPSPDFGVAFLPDMAMSILSDLAMLMPRPGIRYEFRITDLSWQAAAPFHLRDKWWVPIICTNSGTNVPVIVKDGGGGVDWQRCETLQPLSPFVGSFFSLAHPNWGDQGNLGTVGNAPGPCTPTVGTEWRITDLLQNKVLYAGRLAGLRCQDIGGQSRHMFP